MMGGVSAPSRRRWVRSSEGLMYGRHPSGFRDAVATRGLEWRGGELSTAADRSCDLAAEAVRWSCSTVSKAFIGTTPQDPWLVLRDVPEAQALEEMCRALDIRWHRETSTDLIMQTQPAVAKVYMTGTPATALLQYLQSAGIPARPDLERSRFSRSGGRIKASEVGVQFIQRANARLGDGRDAHRLLLVLAAALLLPTQI